MLISQPDSWQNQCFLLFRFTMPVMCPNCGDQFNTDRGLAVHHNKKHGYDNIFGNRPHKKRALNKHVKCLFCDELFDSAFFTITHKHACKEEVVQQEGNCSPHDDDTGEASNDFSNNDTPSSLDVYLTDDAATSMRLVVPGGVSKLTLTPPPRPPDGRLGVGHRRIRHTPSPHHATDATHTQI
jgi:hypothetical protein